MLPKNLFLDLSKNYDSVNYKVKKLPAHIVFLAIFETLIRGLSFSLRSFSETFNSAKFQKGVLEPNNYLTIDHTSLHHRLNKIDSGYFRDIFEAVKKKFARHLIGRNKKYQPLIFDSTIVTLSDRLLKAGLNIPDQGRKNQIKFTIGYNGIIPIVSKCYTNKKYHSENNALAETILGTKISKNQIILVDRGLQRRSTYDQITEQGNFFIGGFQLNYLVDVVGEITQNLEGNITKELQGYLYGAGKIRKTKYPYRIVHAIHAPELKQVLDSETQAKEIVFVTNIPAEVMSAEEIAETYRRRWDIEVFFRFLKQNLHFSHLVNRTENGIKSIMYIIMTYAIILLAYKKLNSLTGYRHVKAAFMMDFLEERARLRTLAGREMGSVFSLQFW